MIFEHCNYLGDLELNKKETKGIRLYNLPNGDWVPSITSVTSFYNRQIFADWRKRVGIEEANRITKKATCLLYTSPSPRDRTRSRMPSSA